MVIAAPWPWHDRGMPDFYNAVTDLDSAVTEQLGIAMELRATEPQ